jgi:putative transposase
VQAGQTPGFPRFQGRTRYHSCTDKQEGNGAHRDNGLLALSKIGRLAVRWSRPLAGTPKTVTISHEADGWDVCFACADVPARPLPRTGRGTGMDGGLQAFLITRAGDAVANPRHHRTAEQRLNKAQRRVSRRQQGSKRRKKAVKVLAQKHQKVHRQRQDFLPTTANTLLRQDDTISLDDVRGANLGRNHHLANSSSDAGWGDSAPSLQPRQQAPGVTSSPCHPPLPARIGVAVARASPSACAGAPTFAPPVVSCSREMNTQHEPFNGPGRPFEQSWR